MTTGNKPSRAELGESAFKGLGGRVPRALVHGDYGDRHLALDDHYLYWTDDRTGELSRIPKGGGGPLVLAQANYPGYLALVDGYLYWTQHQEEAPGFRRQHDGGPLGSVVRMPVDGGAIEVVAADLHAPNEVAVSGREVAISCDGPFYYDRKEEVTGSIVRATIGGAKPRVVATKQRRPESLAFVDGDLYWVNYGWKWPDYFADGAVLRMPRDGAKKRWIVRKNQPMAGSLVVDDAHLYWVTSSTLVDRSLSGAIYRRPRAGGPVVAVAEFDEPEGALLAQDRTHLYWLSHAFGAMYRLAKAGGAVERMMTCDERIAICASLAVDEHRVYWTTSDARTLGGAVWSMAKEPARLRAAPEPEAPRAN